MDELPEDFFRVWSWIECVWNGAWDPVFLIPGDGVAADRTLSSQAVEEH